MGMVGVDLQLDLMVLQVFSLTVLWSHKYYCIILLTGLQGRIKVGIILPAMNIYRL